MVQQEERLQLFGEDLGYLLEEIQQTFWVQFTEEDLIECLSVGELFDRILSKMSPIRSPSLYYQRGVLSPSGPAFSDDGRGSATD